MGTRCNPRHVRGLRAYVGVASLVTTCMGMAVLIGWLLIEQGLLVPGRGALLRFPEFLHPFSGLSSVLLGISLWLQRRESVKPHALHWARGLALAVVTLMVVVALGHLVGPFPNLDQVVFVRETARPPAERPVAPNALVAYLFLGVSLLLLNASSRALQRTSRFLALVSCVIAFLPLVGHLFRVAAFTRVTATFLPMALHTAVGLLILGAGVLAARPQRGFMALICSDGLGGTLLRRLLPVLVLAPILLGLSGVWAERAMGVDAASGIGFLVTGMVVVSAAVLWWNSGVLERVEAALVSSESKLRTLIDTSPDLIMIRDREGRYLLANPAFAKMVGRPPAEILGRRDVELFDPETAARIAQSDRQVMESQTSVEYEISIQTPGGVARIYESSKYPYHSDGELVGVIAISRDVTERKRLEAQLRAQYEKLKELDKLKGDFVNAVSHDLRTPLTSILGYAEFLEDGIGGPITESQRQFVAQITKGTKRLEGMVNDLLDFARLDAGTFRLHCEETDLAMRVQELVESLRPQAEEKHLTLSVQVPEGPLTRVLDPQRIERVLANLIGNALKFTAEGGRIAVRVTEDDAGVLCEVEDTGIGIAPEDLPKLFQRFTQLEAGARMKAGTGLGLSISKAQIEAHGGTIGVRSEPGKGSTFWFRLPRGVPPQCGLDQGAV